MHYILLNILYNIEHIVSSSTHCIPLTAMHLIGHIVSY